MTYKAIVGVLIICLTCACSSNEFIPKPKGFNRIDLPAHSYEKLKKTSYPYVFEHSTLAKVQDDTTGLFEKDWVIIHYPAFNSSIHITYKKINNDPKLLNQYIDDAYKLAYKHNVRATSIEPEMIVTKNGKQATIIRLEGDVPSPYQFFTHDSTSNFMRGVLYFPVADKNDSLAPVINYVIDDLKHLLNTLEWK